MPHLYFGKHQLRDISLENVFLGILFEKQNKRFAPTKVRKSTLWTPSEFSLITVIDIGNNFIQYNYLGCYTTNSQIMGLSNRVNIDGDSFDQALAIFEFWKGRILIGLYRQEKNGRLMLHLRSNHVRYRSCKGWILKSPICTLCNMEEKGLFWSPPVTTSLKMDYTILSRRKISS